MNRLTVCCAVLALIVWRQRVWLEMARQDADRWRGLCGEWRALREIREGGAKPQNIDPPTRDSGGLQKRGL